MGIGPSWEGGHDETEQFTPEGQEAEKGGIQDEVRVR